MASSFHGRLPTGAVLLFAIAAMTLAFATVGVSGFTISALFARGGASHQYNALAIGREMASRGHRFTLLLAKDEPTRLGDGIQILSRDPSTYDSRYLCVRCPPRSSGLPPVNGDECR